MRTRKNLDSFFIDYLDLSFSLFFLVSIFLLFSIFGLSLDFIFYRKKVLNSFENVIKKPHLSLLFCQSNLLGFLLQSLAQFRESLSNEHALEDFIKDIFCSKRCGRHHKWCKDPGPLQGAWGSLRVIWFNRTLKHCFHGNNMSLS